MPTATAFINANIFDGKRSSGKGQTVVVENGRIRGIGHGEAPSHAEVFDLDGRTLMPGMTVGHWHGEYENIGPPLFSAGRGGVGIGTEEPPLVLGLMAARSLQTALMSGVTRVVSGSCGNDADWQLKVAIERGLLDGPRVTPCSRHVITTADFEDRCQWWKTDMMSDGIRRLGGNVIADGPAQIAKAVRQEILRGAEVIKLLPTGGHGFDADDRYRGMSRAEFETAVTTAHERGARVRTHVSSKRGILECLELGVDIIDHADALDEECIEALLKNDAILVPSMLFTKMVSYAGVGDATPGRQMDMAWDNMREMLAKANAAGVTIVPGDDFGAQGMEHTPGVYARELLVYTEDMGIPAADVLRWATSNGAKLGLDDQNGSIEEGKIADLIVINGDPVEDLALLRDPENNLALVMLEGRLVKNALTGEGRTAKTGNGAFVPTLPSQIAAE